ncbi:creatinine amidohydrolase [Agromyces ramosus]|uniref:Creatinine amidohydrolase n=1 Tax=Agromyces ramosus TaxID=33879 RepID=A0A4Q7MD56_9MICO|nr:mycofactocin biosynthesis peptidyl-dipeptidase MftE [Agromyces ramosus]RZS64652.1 creatinine amidohydrolase [Agromyces ramosus]
MIGPGEPRLVDRPWPDVGRPTVLVPVGSTEQHGPHLPLDTDTVVASAVAEALAVRLRAEGVDAVVTPAIAFGASGEHQGFPGTISVGTQALTFLLLEFGRSACEWADRVVFVNGHGGNVEALATAVPVLIDEERPASWLPCVPGARALGDDVPVDAHAGRSETSILQRLEPDRVRVDRLEAGDPRPVVELMPLLRDAGVGGVAPNGVLGDPRAASPAEGSALLESIIAEAWLRLRSGRVDARGCGTHGDGEPDPTTGAIS